LIEVFSTDDSQISKVCNCELIDKYSDQGTSLLLFYMYPLYIWQGLCVRFQQCIQHALTVILFIYKGEWNLVIHSKIDVTGGHVKWKPSFYKEEQ
jgi:hypothetical protein